MQRLPLQVGTRRDADDIVPARLTGRLLLAGNPNRREILSASAVFAMAEAIADHKQCLGASLGYLEILRRYYFDLTGVERVLVLFEL